MLLFWKLILKTQISKPREAASYRNLTKLLILLPLRAIYFYSLCYETPCTMIPQVGWFSFVFWRKSKTPKNHFEIIWPLVSTMQNFCLVFRLLKKRILFLEARKQKKVSKIMTSHHFLFQFENWSEDQKLHWNMHYPKTYCSWAFKSLGF